MTVWKGAERHNSSRDNSNGREGHCRGAALTRKNEGGYTAPGRRWYRQLGGAMRGFAPICFGLMIVLFAPGGGTIEGASNSIALPNHPESDVVTNTIGMKLVLIKAGTFMMGSLKDEDDEKPVHKVTISKPFFMGVHEVTQKQYLEVVGSSPAEFPDTAGPVEQVSWDDAMTFCQKLSEREKAEYRLPTEAEWEYCCRAGMTEDPSLDEKGLGELGWCNRNSNGHTHPVGCKKPNPWGLYDMHGNVNEWCMDWYGFYPSGDQIDPIGPESGERRVVRGSSWMGDTRFFRYGRRGNFAPEERNDVLGFRVIRAVSAR